MERTEANTTDITNADLSDATTLAGLIEAAATADGRTYIDWGLVYLFASASAVPILHTANHATLLAVLAAGFDPFTDNIGHADIKATAAIQIAA